MFTDDFFIEMLNKAKVYIYLCRG